MSDLGQEHAILILRLLSGEGAMLLDHPRHMSTVPKSKQGCGNGVQTAVHLHDVLASFQASQLVGIHV